MTKKTDTPAIRFKGFSDTWEQRKFSDFAQRESSVQLSSPDCPCVEYEDVVEEEGRLDKDIRQKEVQKSGIKFDGTQVLYGKLRPYLHNWLNPDFTGVAVGDWWVLRPICIDKNYLYRLIQTKQFDDVANQSAGSKMPRADWNLVSNKEFYIPISMEEQSKIAMTFTNLDRLITLHQRKYEKLHNIKKSMLEKMFPKNGSNVPEIRFKGFTEAWEQRKLGELTSLITKGTTPLDKSNVGTVNFVKIESIDNSSGEITITQKISSEEHEGYLRRSQLKENDILFSIAGTLGRVTSVKSSILPANTNQALAIIRLKSGCLKYVKTYLKGKAVADFIKKNPTIGAQPNLSLEQVSNLEIALPSDIEQEQIGSFFENLDNLITLHQRELEKLQNIKKSMLEKMFV